MAKIKENIFREYDIRGTYPDELNEETVTLLGRAIGTYYRRNNAKRITLGRDCRLSSPNLSNWLKNGLLDTGMEIYELGVVPTPVVYFSVHMMDVDGGVQITGSHNPPEFNGFKICLGKETIYGEEIQKIRRICEKEDFVKGEGRIEKAEIISRYIDYVVNNIKPGPYKKKVVVDGGNGTACEVAVEIYRRLGFDIIPLYCEPDGSFPNHHPDPTIPEYLKDLIEKVKEEKSDLGIAFDGDGDRIGVVDSSGDIIWGDQLMIIFSRELLRRYRGGKIIGEVKCSQVLYNEIEKSGGTPIMWKTGHSLIKKKMKEEGALLAGEMSGHLFFAERYFGYDDAIYAGARLLEILSQRKESIKEMLSDIPKMVNTPEIRIDCPDEIKFQVVSEIAKEFKEEGYKVVDVDGARVIFEDGWGLVRASNTQPVLVLRFEAKDEESLKRIKDIFRKKLEKKGIKGI